MDSQAEPSSIPASSQTNLGKTLSQMASDMPTEARPGVRRVVTGHRAADGVAVVTSDRTMPSYEVRTWETSGCLMPR